MFRKHSAVSVLTICKSCFVCIVSLSPMCFSYSYVHFIYVICWFYNNSVYYIFCKQLIFGTFVLCSAITNRFDFFRWFVSYFSVALFYYLCYVFGATVAVFVFLLKSSCWGKMFVNGFNECFSFLLYRNFNVAFFENKTIFYVLHYCMWTKSFI